MASFTGLDAENLTPLHLTYGLLQGMVDELYEMYREYLSLCPPPALLVGSGNGLRKNPRLQSLVSRTFSMKQYVPKSRGGRLRRRTLRIPSVLTQFRIKKALAPVVGANAFCFSQPLTEMDQQFSYCLPGSRVIRSGCSSNTVTLSCSEGSETHGSMQT